MTSRPGLRERKKHRTRQLLQQEALKLFVSQGYDGTTVEQICDAAEISPSTFFRYFPSKEDVVFADDHVPLAEWPADGRDPDEPIADVVRATLFDLLERRIIQDRATMLARMRLASEVPALRARMWQQQQSRVTRTAALLAGRAGKDEDDYDIRVSAAVLVAVITETMLFWADNDGRPELAALFTRALDHLGGLTL